MHLAHLAVHRKLLESLFHKNLFPKTFATEYKTYRNKNTGGTIQMQNVAGNVSGENRSTRQ